MLNREFDEEGVRVNYYLEIEINEGERFVSSAAEGVLGSRKGKSMRGSYWRYLETVASRLAGSKISNDELSSGHPRELKKWLAETDELLAGISIFNISRRAKIRESVGTVGKLVEGIFTSLAVQLKNPEHELPPSSKSISTALLIRSSRVLYLPENAPPTYSYQPYDQSGEGLGSGPEWLPNAFDDAKLMEPLGNADAKSHLVERECLRQGLDILRSGRGVFTASRQDKTFFFKLSRSPLVTVDAIALCTHKEATREFLAPLGFPVPRGRMFPPGDYANATRYANLIGYPVVLKPVTGVRGIGVVPHIMNDQELQDAFQVLEISKLGHDDFIVEKHIFGDDYRIMVIGGKVRAATLRAPASVMGDGEHTVAELMLIKNRYRQKIPHLKSRPIVYDESTQYQLDRQGLSLESVPPKGTRVMLSGSCNLSQGGDSVNVHREMHPSIIKLAEDAVSAVPGLGYCGIDFLIGDHRKPVGETDIGICELNAHAAIGTACYPMYGDPVNVPRDAIEEILLNGDLPLSPLDEGMIKVKVEVRGKVTGVGFRNWLARYANKSGVTGHVKNAGRRKVVALLQGNLVAVSSITSACIRGPLGALPTSVSVTHDDGASHKKFKIVR